MNICKLPEQDWDIAVVLDACRFDTFEKHHENYLKGGNLKAERGGSCTTQWLKKVFSKKYEDIIYVSGNPWINSIIPWNGFNPTEKFNQIVDVWKYGWDEKKETVPPEPVTESAKIVYEEMDQNKRLLIHYLQPHYPYLSLDIPKEVKMHFDGINGNGAGFKHKASKFLKEKLERTIGRERIWKTRQFLKFDSNNVEEYIWRQTTQEELKKLYEENLKTVLKEVRKLTENFDGKMVVTSDHGEALGDEGEYFHPYGTKNEAVRKIPYWETKLS